MGKKEKRGLSAADKHRRAQKKKQLKKNKEERREKVDAVVLSFIFTSVISEGTCFFALVWSSSATNQPGWKVTRAHHGDDSKDKSPRTSSGEGRH
jgi:hypothetical protein